MTIVTSTSNPFLQSPRGPQKKSPVAPNKPQQPLFGRKPSHDPGKVVQVPDEQGQLVDRFYRMNGLIPTNERLPVKTGGLGEVCYTITKAMAKYGDPESQGLKYGGKPRDLRVVVPYLQTNRLQDQEFNKLIQNKQKNIDKIQSLTRKGEANLLQGEQDDLAAAKAESDKLKTLREEYGEPFKPTNVTVTAKVKDKDYKFQVMQAFEPVYENGKPITDEKSLREDKRLGTYVYALKNDALFSNTEKIDTYDSLSKASLELLTPFNQAVGQLVPYLEGEVKKLPECKTGEVPLATFPNGKLDFVVGNDWLTGPTLYQDGIRERDDIHKIFFMHNSYDSGAVPAEEAGYDRKWPLPDHLTKADDVFSQLTLSLMAADAMVANRNFVKTLIQTDFGKGQSFVPAIREHFNRGTIFDMHHGLAESYRPDQNEFLRANRDTEYMGEDKKRKKMLELAAPEGKKIEAYQFKELDKAALLPNTSPEDKTNLWDKFKKENKKALQLKYGLKEDPNAIVMSWAARLEPNQKGFYLVQNAIEKVLDEAKKNGKNVQILIAGNIGDPAKYGPNERMLDNWIKEVNKKYATKPGENKVYIPNAFVSKQEITQMNAGSDFTILPSLYEPYGLTQLEAIKMGSIPLVNGVDGLRTTVSDEHIRTKPDFDFIGREQDGHEKVWEYGQTGVVMTPFNVPKYREAIMRKQSYNVLRYNVQNSQDGALQWSPNTKEVFKTLHEDLVENEARFPDGSKEQQAIKALAVRMGKAQTSTTLKEKDLAVLKLIEDKDKREFIDNAEEQFTVAMNRAIDLADPKKMVDVKDPKTGKVMRKMPLIAHVRENGYRFMEENHRWDQLIKNRYYPLLDAVIDVDKRGEIFSFNNTPPFPRTNAPKKPSQPPAEPKGYLAQQWAKFKAAFMTFIYYLNIFNWFKKPGVKQNESAQAG